MPAVKLDVTTEFADLRGRHVTKGRFIQTALQSIDFSLDETGVKLRSEAAMAVGCSAKPAIEPRLIIVRPPFAVLMKRRNAPQPYFLAWFANAEFLQP